MAETAFAVELFLFGLFTFFEIILGFVQSYRLWEGYRPTRLSHGVLGAAIGATIIQFVRAFDPSGAYGRFNGPTLLTFSHIVYTLIVIAGCQGVYEMVASVFYDATRLPRSYTSKGLRKLRRAMEAVSAATVVVSLTTIILALGTSKEAYTGGWLIYLALVAAYLSFQFAGSTHWLRQRLKKHFKKQFPERREYKARAKWWADRLTFVRYGMIIGAGIIMIVFLTIGIPTTTREDDIEPADPNDYEFFEFFTMWLQHLFIIVMYANGWTSVEEEKREELRQKKMLKKLKKEASKREEDPHAVGGVELEAVGASKDEREAAFQAAAAKKARKKKKKQTGSSPGLQRMNTFEHKEKMRQEQMKKFMPSTSSLSEAEPEEVDKPSVQEPDDVAPTIPEVEESNQPLAESNEDGLKVSASEDVVLDVEVEQAEQKE